MITYCKSIYNYQRRSSRVVTLGGLKMGGHYPIRIQSMLTAHTLDTDACVRETLGLVSLGCEIVRLTAPTVRDAANLKNIHNALHAQGCSVPLVADIHFKPEAAIEAAQWVEKIRINPGNFADSKKFHVRDYTDVEYEEELERIYKRFSPLVKRCKERGVAMRIGTNHGSLSDRIMNRFGDSPLGMVESALEFARIARSLNYHNFVFSMKASNPKVMIAAYRLLVARLGAQGDDWNYPIHLGVTEAGDGEDGRIKSAIGIGSLLADGIGDTLRISLTEDSQYEIPVARALLAEQNIRAFPASLLETTVPPSWSFFTYERRPASKLILGSYDLARIFHTDLLRRPGNQMDPALDSHFDLGGMYTYSPASKYLSALPHQPSQSPRHDQYEISGLGGDAPVRVVVTRQTYQEVASQVSTLGEYQPEFILEDLLHKEIDPRSESEIQALQEENVLCLVTVRDGLDLDPIAAFRLLAARIPKTFPILLKDTLRKENMTREDTKDITNSLLSSSVVLGSLLCDGIGDAILVRRISSAQESLRVAYNILQAAGVRIFKTDYVACPSCGRTLFNLQETTARIKASTGHLKGVRIAIMGCIVNGPGEMADADFGYVGGAPGKVNLYVGKKVVKFNIPQAKALEELIALIQEHGKWVEQ